MKKIVFSLLGLALFLYIVVSVGLSAIMASFLALNPVFLGIALVLLVPVLLLKGLKQGIILSPFARGTGLFDNTKIWLIGFFFGAASPAKSGDAARALYLKQKFNVSLGQGLAVVFVERIADLAMLFIFAFAGLVVLGSGMAIGTFLPVMLISFCLAFVAVVVLALKRDLIRPLIRPFFNLLVPEKFKEKLKEGFDGFYRAISSYKKGNLVWIAVVTFISWIFAFFQIYFIALALSINVPFIYFLFALPVIILVEALPVSISGIGTRDAASILMFGLLGVAAGTAVAFSLAMLSFNIVVAAVGFAFFNSEGKPI